MQRGTATSTILYCLAVQLADSDNRPHQCDGPSSNSMKQLYRTALTWLFMPTARWPGPKLHSAGSQSTAMAVLVRVAVSTTVTSPMLVRLARRVPKAANTWGSAAR